MNTTVIDKAIDKARLRWRCKRGMLELDLILIAYFEKYYDSLSPSEQQQFKQLLECTDPEIYGWLLGFVEVSHEELIEIVQHIKARM